MWGVGVLCVGFVSRCTVVNRGDVWWGVLFLSRCGCGFCVSYVPWCGGFCRFVYEGVVVCRELLGR